MFPQMLVTLLKSKIHRATVTGSSADYEGSLTIDLELMEKTGMVPYERILASNMANGARFETYAIPGERGKREIILNGATAHMGKPGDLLTIMSFVELEPAHVPQWKPKVVVLGRSNSIVTERGI